MRSKEQKAPTPKENIYSTERYASVGVSLTAMCDVDLSCYLSDFLLYFPFLLFFVADLLFLTFVGLMLLFQFPIGNPSKKEREE